MVRGEKEIGKHAINMVSPLHRSFCFDFALIENTSFEP